MSESAAFAAGLADATIPRSNGTPTFDAPWQGRALAMAILLVEQTGVEWEDFRRHLIAAIADDPERPYWDSFADALERFADEAGVTTDTSRRDRPS